MSFNLPQPNDNSDIHSFLSTLHNIQQNLEVPSEFQKEHIEQKADHAQATLCYSAVQNAVLAEILDLDDSTVELMSVHGLDPAYIITENPEVQIEIMYAINETYSWLAQQAETRESELNLTFIKEIHKRLSSDLSEDGNFRKSDVLDDDNLLPEDFDPIPAAEARKALTDLVSRYKKLKDVSVSEKAAWLHTEFLKISPFQSLNSTTARALASFSLIANGFWPITLSKSHWSRYCEAVKSSLKDNLEPLANLLAYLQSDVAFQMLYFGLKIQTTVQASEAFGTLLDRPSPTSVQQKNGVTAHPKNFEALWEAAQAYFANLVDDYNSNYKNPSGNVSVPAFQDAADNESQDRRHWYLFQVVKAARQFNYWAVPEKYHSWAKLGINSENGRFEMLLSFHSMGKDYEGTIACSLSCYSRLMGHGARKILNFQTLCDEPFILNPAVDEKQSVSSFIEWLSAAATKGITLAKNSGY